MPDVRDARVRVVVSALLALLAVSTPTAQKQTSEKSPGTGVTVSRYFNPDGAVYRSEFVDAKGILFKVETSTWDPDPPHPPSADSRATLEKLMQERLRAKLAFEHAREAILNSVGAQIRDAWQSAVAEHKAASTRQAHARVALEKTWRVTGG